MVIRALYASSQDWAAVGGEMEELLRRPEFRVVKQTSRTLAGIAQLNGVEVFVKRVTTGSWAAGIVARICGSRARKTIGGAAILHRAGFSYPRLIAAFEDRQGGSIRTSYVIVEYLRRAKILSRFALADGHDLRWRSWLSQRLAQKIRSLHDAGCYTRDLQETNLMLEARDRGVRIYFTDLEDFRWLPRVPQRLRLRNLLHLDRSIGRFVSRAHRLRFFYNYLGGKPRHAQARALLAHLHAIRRRIERRNRRRERSTAILVPPMERPHSE